MDPRWPLNMQPTGIHFDPMTRYLGMNNNTTYTHYLLNRPVPTPMEQPSRFNPNRVLDRSTPAGYENWPVPQFNPTHIIGGNGIVPPLPPDLGRGGLPTISWLCSCSLCVDSVQQFITSLNNSNGVYAACISSCGPVYNELLSSAQVQMQPPPQILTTAANGTSNGTAENISVASIGIGSEDASVSVKIDTNRTGAEDGNSTELDDESVANAGSNNVVRRPAAQGNENQKDDKSDSSKKPEQGGNESVAEQPATSGDATIFESGNNNEGTFIWRNGGNWMSIGKEEGTGMTSENFDYSQNYNHWNGFPNQMDIFPLAPDTKNSAQASNDNTNNNL